jgi:hypothetical protein
VGSVVFLYVYGNMAGRHSVCPVAPDQDCPGCVVLACIILPPPFMRAITDHYML